MSTDFSAATWTAADLLTEVYAKCRMPDGGTIDWTPSVVLQRASNAIWDWAGSLIAGAGQGRAVTTLSRAVTSSAVDSGYAEYELPPMAQADAIDAVMWVDSSGARQRRLETIPPAMESIFTQPTNTGCPEVYALKAGTIRIMPRPSESGTLSIQYMRRHGQLVSGTDTTSVVSIASASAGAATAITVGAVPSSFVSGAWIDVMGRYLPYRTKVHGARITGVVGLVVTVAVAYADMVAAQVTDDTLCIYGKTPYVQLPLELRQPLVQHVSSGILLDLGDTKLAEANDALAGLGAQRAQTQLSPRVRSTPQKMFNPFSLARGGVRRRWPGQ